MGFGTNMGPRVGFDGIIATPQPPVAGPLLWLRADLGVTGTSTVDLWEDQVDDDANKDCVGSGATRPALVTADSGYPIPRPAIQFTGSQKLLSGTWSAALVKPYTIVCIGYDLSTGGSKYAFDSLSAVAQAGLFGNSALGTTIVGGAALPGGPEPLTAACFICIFNDASSSIRISAATPVVTGQTTTKTITGTTIGNTAGGGAFANWSIAELIYYGSVLGSSDIALVNAYAATRYGFMIGP